MKRPVRYIWTEIKTTQGYFLVQSAGKRKKAPFQECLHMTIEPGTDREENVFAIQVNK